MKGGFQRRLKNGLQKIKVKTVKNIIINSLSYEIKLNYAHIASFTNKYERGLFDKPRVLALQPSS
jgi:hypothetical protein